MAFSAEPVHAYIEKALGHASAAEDLDGDDPSVIDECFDAVFWGLTCATLGDQETWTESVVGTDAAASIVDPNKMSSALQRFLVNADDTLGGSSSVGRSSAAAISGILDAASDIHRMYQDSRAFSLDATDIARAMLSLGRFLSLLAELYPSSEHSVVESIEEQRSTSASDVEVSDTPAGDECKASLRWSEAETREFIIDRLLEEAGWTGPARVSREFQVAGMPNDSGTGSVDYVLSSDDGSPLALIEAKRTSVSELAGKEQADQYAECLRAMTGVRPIVFYTNGVRTWLWPDRDTAPRPVQGFLTAEDLMYLRDSPSPQAALSRPDSGLHVDTNIAGREYQQEAILKVCGRFADGHREALVVMATGAGKTRTVIGLVDLLQRTNCIKRVLFLADRTALVQQAVNAFKTHLPDAAPVNLVTEPYRDGRICVSTYQTMIGKLNERDASGRRRFSTGHFDLVVVDEAHRSIYRKYRRILEYFDTLLVGLTATPKSEVDRNTYAMFGIRDGEPTSEYTLQEAIDAGYLVPPTAISVPLRFVQRGIKYSELDEAEKEQWDELDWGEDDSGQRAAPPDMVDAEALNNYLFNADTVDKALQFLDAERNQSRRRGPSGQDDHIRTEPAACRVHLRAFRRTAPERSSGKIRRGHYSRSRQRAATHR